MGVKKEIKPEELPCGRTRDYNATFLVPLIIYQTIFVFRLLLKNELTLFHRYFKRLINCSSLNKISFFYLILYNTYYCRITTRPFMETNQTMAPDQGLSSLGRGDI